MNLSPSQFELFDAFEPTPSRAPKLALPFQRSNEIDVKRARKILGVNVKTIRRMLEQGLLRGYHHAGSSSPWHIEYDSVVEYCDRLRVLHCISDRRAGLAGTRRRYRDHELLPFPLDETLSLPEVRKLLDCSHTSVIHLIESGSLTAYQVIFQMVGCPWRIHTPSVERYIQSLHTMAGKRAGARPTPSSR